MNRAKKVNQNENGASRQRFKVTSEYSKKDYTKLARIAKKLGIKPAVLVRQMMKEVLNQVSAKA